MADPDPLPPPAEPKVERRRWRLSPIWLVPLIAALIGAWIAWKSWSETGPMIRISFRHAEGLEPGKTPIRYKHLEMGVVQSIELAPDLQQVIVHARMNAGAGRFLHDDTRFWIVQPHLGVDQISGLQTLISGVYVGMDIGRGEATRRDFVGLDEVPAVEINAPGRYFVLRAAGRRGLSNNSPVMHRQIPVGRVVDIDLTEDAGAVEIRIFVEAPYDRLVTSNTLFWNASGVSAELTGEGVAVRLESLASLISGGIGFGPAEGLPPGAAVAEDHRFALAESRAEAQQNRYTERERFRLLFDGSVRGLREGASVELNGIPIGRVLDVHLELDTDTLEFHTPVTIELTVDRIAVGDRAADAEQRERVLEQMVERGLRARLQSGNLLTGSRFVELVMLDDAEPAGIDRSGPLPRLPTVPARLDELSQRLSELLGRIEDLPLEAIGENLEQTLAGSRRLANAPELERMLADWSAAGRALSATLNGLAPRLDPLAEDTLAMLADVRRAANTFNAAMAGVEQIAGTNSATQQDLRKALKEIATAARALRSFAEYLERHPDALLRGR